MNEKRILIILTIFGVFILTSLVLWMPDFQNIIVDTIKENNPLSHKDPLNHEDALDHEDPLKHEDPVDDSSPILDRNVTFIDISPEVNPLLAELKEPEGPLIRANDTRQIPATFLSLVRNEEIKGILEAMRQIEQTFNHKFNYPWTFFNDQEFTEGFKRQTSAATNANCTYVKLSAEEWEEPEWINRKLALDKGKEMKEKENIQHADQASYHRMCRWNSGVFALNPALDNYKYYWRVEPKTKYYCDIDYDVFAYMEDNNKDYGFVLNLYDSAQSVRNLWPTLRSFFDKNPDYIHPNNAKQWLLNTQRKNHNDVASYSTCHFWSNFEIGNLEFFRSPPYQEYFNHLDQAGGFFYERWGDAPVHSIALALMMDKNRIHWFKDIGYWHLPYWNCPTSDKCSGCKPGQFSDSRDLLKENCMNEWLKVAGDQ